MTSATGHPTARPLPRLFWVLWSGILVNRLGTLVEPFLGIYLVAVRGFAVTAAGGVLAIYALGLIVSQMLGGLLADALGRRPTLALGMLANACSLLMLGYLTAAPAVTAAAFAAGATIDIYRPAAQALVADLIPAAGRARAYALISWAANLGFAAAMLGGGLLAQAGFRWLFWADALTCVAFAALAWRAMPATRPRPPARGSNPGGFGHVLRDRVMAGFALVALGYTTVYQQAFTTLPIAMGERGLPPRAYGLVMAVNGIVIVTVQPLAGRWLAGRDPSLVVVAGNVLTAAGFAATAPAATIFGYAGPVCVWTLGEIAMTAAGAAIVTGLAPAHLRGRYLGLYGAASALGALLAPLAGTLLLGLGAPALWLTCGALAAAAALGQTTLAPAIRHRTSPPGSDPPARAKETRRPRGLRGRPRRRRRHGCGAALGGPVAGYPSGELAGTGPPGGEAGHRVDREGPPSAGNRPDPAGRADGLGGVRDGQPGRHSDRLEGTVLLTPVPATVPGVAARRPP